MAEPPEDQSIENGRLVPSSVQEASVIMPELLFPEYMLPAPAASTSDGMTHQQQLEEQRAWYQQQYHLIWLELQKQQMLQQQAQQEHTQQHVPAAVRVKDALAAVDKLDAAAHTKLLRKLVKQHPEARALVMQLAVEQFEAVDVEHWEDTAWDALHQLDGYKDPYQQSNHSVVVDEGLRKVIDKAAALPRPR
jgi:hypothetical protein